MNLTLLAAIALLLLWGILVFAMHLGSGPVQVLYALAVVLFARRSSCRDSGAAPVPGRRRRPTGPIYFEPNVTPTVSGKNFVDPPEVWTLT
jgi:hypothetical protein